MKIGTIEPYKMKFRLYIVFLFFLCIILFPNVSSAAKVAIIKSKDIVPYSMVSDGFKVAIDASIVEYDIEGDMEKGRDITEKIKADQPDLILAIGTKAAMVVYQNIKNIPIVFVMVSRPEAYGLIGENITGVSLNIPSYDQLKIMKSILPGIKKVGIIYNPKISGKTVAAADEDASRLNLELIHQEIISPKEVPRALRNLKGSIDALWMVMDKTFVDPKALKHIQLFTLRNKIPFMGLSVRFVQDGALLALSSDYQDMGRQAGQIAKQIILGKSTSDLPISSPEKLTLVLNLKTAKIIDVYFSPEVISKAVRIFE